MGAAEENFEGALGCRHFFLRRLNEVASQPIRESVSVYFSSRDSENNVRLLLLAGGNLVTIQYQKCFQRSMTCALITVHKWMVLNQGKAKSRRLFNYRWVKFFAVKGHAWLCDCRLQQAKVENSHRTTGLIHHTAVDFHHFSHRQVTHLCQPFVEVRVLA